MPSKAEIKRKRNNEFIIASEERMKYRYSPGCEKEFKLYE
jgi:hypothetical protein